MVECIFDHISGTRFFPKPLALLNLYQHGKNQLIPSINSWDTADFGVLRPKRPHPFPTNTMQKSLKGTFNFPEFLSTHKKSAYSIDCFLQCSQVYCPETRVATPIFDNTHANTFQSTFNFHEYASICKKPGFFIILF